MIYSNPDQIGILACPGGEEFADKLIAKLEKISVKKIRRKIQALSVKYCLSRDEVMRLININIDQRRPNLNPETPADRFRPTSFKIPAHFTRFANGEFKTELLSTVRNMDVYIIQDVENHYPLSFDNGNDKQVLSVNDHIFLLFVTIDAAMQAGAKRVTVVLPAYPYARQHKKKGREGLTAARLGQILEYLGVARLITLDLHSKEIENSFNLLRVENLHASYQILKTLSQVEDLQSEDLVIISPDTGAVDRNKFFSSALKKPLGLIYKERDYSRVSYTARDSNITSIRLLGEVKDKIVFMADDMLGTGGTILKAMAALKDRGARRIICAVSLPFFNGPAIEQFEEAYRNNILYRVIGTNAVYHDADLLDREWYLNAEVDDLFARSIYRIHYNLSLSSLMDNTKIINDLLDKNSKRLLSDK